MYNRKKGNFDENNNSDDEDENDDVVILDEILEIMDNDNNDCH